MRRRGLRRTLPRWWLVVAAVVALVVWVERAIVPPLLAYAGQQAHKLAVQALGRAVERVLAAGPRYDQLVVFHRDADGRVRSYQVDTVRLARLLAALQQAVQEELPPQNGTEIPIPLGVVLGSELLAAYGPRLQAMVVPVGEAEVSVAHRFEQAGINQTRHLIYARVEMRVRIILPLHRQVTVVRNEFPLVDTVIVGEVPPAWFSLPPWPLAPPR